MKTISFAPTIHQKFLYGLLCICISAVIGICCEFNAPKQLSEAREESKSAKFMQQIVKSTKPDNHTVLACQNMPK